MSATPQERVEAYVRQFHAVWKSALERMGEHVDFDLWGAMVRDLDAQHFVAGRRSGSEGSFSRVPAEHSPESERVVAVTDHGDTATVETEAKGPLTRYFEYSVRRVDGDWRL